MTTDAKAPPPVHVGTPTIVPGGPISEELQRELYDLVARVGGYNLRRRQLEKQGFEVKARLLKRRGELLVEVNDATNAAGKSLYSNAEQRAAAIVQRCGEDAAYKVDEEERSRLQDEYDRLASEYSVIGDNLDIFMAACGVARPVIESNYKTLFEQIN